MEEIKAQESELTPDQQDEKNCGERIGYWLNKYGCTLHGVAIIENGSARIQVGVQKIPAEVRKAMKEAEKRGQVQTGA